ncbi:hypothetical protein SBF1_50088 [Candidatus Desulfosporosinus infrequens]|uniref:Uncharacterized protein n=1 Tax=Candidatus Desulfosporosinus infrequens TaxID=2043169 RepID=A0A2U3LH75_9FIRM|nr:hypothetical protein SBF1_50088 [Candidatus Desulfosporosinus infrequens]
MKKPITTPCSKCNGGGFFGYGTGYNAVCYECAGTGETLVGWKDEPVNELDQLKAENAKLIELAKGQIDLSEAIEDEKEVEQNEKQ